MRKAMNLILLGGLSLLALAGCNKEGLEQKYSRAAGEEIVFGAVSRSFNPLTKTAYSGVTVTEGEKKIERINWVVGDQFRVYSDKAVHRYNGNSWADYQIMKDPTNNGAESVVTFGVNTDPGIAPITEYKLESDFVSKNGLVWSEGDQEFYAIYPVSESANGASGELSASIPSDQLAGNATNIKDYGVMTAYAKESGSTTNGVTGSADGAVELAFDPAFTAFEITLKAAADETEDIVLKSFELQSGEEALAGNFTVSYNKEGKVGTAVYTCPAATDANKKISVTFPENTTINTETEFTFTVFALPQDFTKLTLSFTVADGEGSVTRKLPLTYVKTEEVEEGETPAYTAGDYVKFDGLKKHRLIGLALSKYKWVFEAVNLDLKWYVDTETLNYDSNPIINAGALYEVSGAASGWERFAAAFAGPNPIVEYFTIFSPKNGKWVVTNSAPTVVTLSAAGATPSEDGTELSGPINGRVDLSIARGSATGTADLNFYVEVGGRRYCINSEVTRSGAQVITNN